MLPIRWAWRLILILALSLPLMACDSGNREREREPQASSGEGGSSVVVSTVAPEQEPEAAPTAAPTMTPTITPSPTPPAPLAALVNGDYVFLADFEQRFSQYEQALLDQGLDPNTEDGQAMLAQARTDVLEGMIDSVLVEQGSAQLGVSVTDQEVEQQLEADVAAGGGQEAFEEWLRATAQTRDDYKEMLRQSMLSQRVMEAVTGEVPSEAEQVHARLIMVDTEEEAQEVLAQIQAGADFVALARQHSLDVATRENGGDVGWFPRGLVAPELETAAFALQPGQVSDVVYLGEGYHIIQVVERQDSRPLSEEMQIDLKRAQFELWLAGLRDSAQIERFAGE
ncbi:MAG: peptidylprolyl isomerase [Anaerolineae bacterium]|jgi:parvulin-like peptidyl-prolyl isomerase